MLPLIYRIDHNIFCVMSAKSLWILFSEIYATLPTTEEDCRLWIFFLNGEELSKETCLGIVHDHEETMYALSVIVHDS